MRKLCLAALSGIAIAALLGGTASAITAVPPTPNLGTLTLTLGGSEQFETFVNVGDTVQLDFTVSMGTDSWTFQ